MTDIEEDSIFMYQEDYQYELLEQIDSVLKDLRQIEK